MVHDPPNLLAIFWSAMTSHELISLTTGWRWTLTLDLSLSGSIFPSTTGLEAQHSTLLDKEHLQKHSNNQEMQTPPQFLRSAVAVPADAHTGTANGFGWTCDGYLRKRVKGMGVIMLERWGITRGTPRPSWKQSISECVTVSTAYTKIKRRIRHTIIKKHLYD